MSEEKTSSEPVSVEVAAMRAACKAIEATEDMLITEPIRLASMSSIWPLLAELACYAISICCPEKKEEADRATASIKAFCDRCATSGIAPGEALLKLYGERPELFEQVVFVCEEQEIQ